MRAPSSVSLHDATPAAALAQPQVAVTEPPTVTCGLDNVTNGPSANCLNSTVAVPFVGSDWLPATSVDVTASVYVCGVSVAGSVTCPGVALNGASSTLRTHDATRENESAHEKSAVTDEPIAATLLDTVSVGTGGVLSILTTVAGVDWPTFPASSIAKPVTSVVPSALTGRSSGRIVLGSLAIVYRTRHDRRTAGVRDVDADRDVALGELGRRGLRHRHDRRHVVDRHRGARGLDVAGRVGGDEVDDRDPLRGDRSRGQLTMPRRFVERDRSNRPTTTDRRRDARHPGAVAVVECLP